MRRCPLFLSLTVLLTPPPPGPRKAGRRGMSHAPAVRQDHRRTPIDRYTLKNANGLEADVITPGAAS